MVSFVRAFWLLARLGCAFGLLILWWWLLMCCLCIAIVLKLFQKIINLLVCRCWRLDPPEVVVRVLCFLDIFLLLLLHLFYQFLHLFGFFVCLILRYELQILLHGILQELVLVKVLVIAISLEEQAFQRVRFPLFLLGLLLGLLLLRVWLIGLLQEVALAKIKPLILLQPSKVSLAKLCPKFTIFSGNQIIIGNIDTGLLLDLLARLRTIIFPDQFDSFLQLRCHLINLCWRHVL